MCFCSVATSLPVASGALELGEVTENKISPGDLRDLRGSQNPAPGNFAASKVTLLLIRRIRVGASPA